MAMRTASPYWFTLVFASGLLFLLLGERAFDHIEGVRLFCSGLGAFIVAAVTALRAWAFMRSDGNRRSVEKVFLLCHAGAIVGLLVYIASIDFGRGLLGFDSMTIEDADRYRNMMTIVWMIILVVSLIPMLLAELALGMALRTRFDLKEASGIGVDEHRVKIMATSGLTIGLAMSFLFVTCGTAEKDNKRVDTSYFRTSSPGDGAIKMVSSISEPVKAMLFFPEPNEVLEEVKGYFQDLSNRSGNLEFEIHDRITSLKLTEQWAIDKDGTVLIMRGDCSDGPAKKGKKAKDGDDDAPECKHDKFTISTKMKTARRKELRNLDKKVQASLNKVIRQRRTVYLTQGHGEISSSRPVMLPGGRFAEVGGVRMLKSILSFLNYKSRDLNPKDLGTTGVPKDAAMVIILGPTLDFTPEEIAALDEYLGKGGAMFLSLGERSTPKLGLLEDRLGLRFKPELLIDPKRPIRDQRGRVNRAAGRAVMMYNISSHASVTTTSQRVKKAAVYNAGHFEVFPPANKPKKFKQSKVLRTPNHVFTDLNKNMVKDGGDKPGAYNVMVAIEDPSSKKPDDKAEEGIPNNGMRVVAVSSAQIFSDQFMKPPRPDAMTAGMILSLDIINWLGGQEDYSGSVESENDEKIDHTRNENTVWFYLCLVGAPLLVIGLGIGMMFMTRRRRLKRSAA